MQCFNAKRFGSMVVAASLTAMAAQHADAAVLIAPPNTADNNIYRPNTDGATVRVWDDRLNDHRLLIGNNNTNYYIGVLVFELPALPDGEFVQTANLDAFYMNGGSGPSSDLDLYGLGFRSEPDVSVDDWFGGGDDDPNATKIQDSLVAASDPEETLYSTDAVGDAALAAFIQAQYDAGAQAGDYLFLRMNTNSSTVLGWFRIASADHEVAANRPNLTITTAPIPEPASLALLGVGGLLIAGRRRSRA